MWDLLPLSIILSRFLLSSMPSSFGTPRHSWWEWIFTRPANSHVSPWLSVKRERGKGEVMKGKFHVAKLAEIPIIFFCRKIEKGATILSFRNVLLEKNILIQELIAMYIHNHYNVKLLKIHRKDLWNLLVLLTMQTWKSLIFENISIVFI